MRYLDQNVKGSFKVDDEESMVRHIEGEVVDIKFTNNDKAMVVDYTVDESRCTVEVCVDYDTYEGGVYEEMSLEDYLRHIERYRTSVETIKGILEINSKHHLIDKIESSLEYFGIHNMKILCRLQTQPLNEAVIAPFDFTPAVEKIRKKRIKSVEQLEAAFDGKVKFISLDQFHGMNPSAKVPKMLNPRYGVMLGTVMNGTVYVVGNVQSIISYLNSWMNRKDAWKSLLDTIRHESVHVQQISKASGNIKDVDDVETMDGYKRYMSNKQELMAYARTIIDEMTPKYSHQQMLQALRSGRLPNSIFQGYVQMFRGDEEVLNRLRKYLYQYLTQESLNEGKWYHAEDDEEEPIDKIEKFLKTKFENKIVHEGGFAYQYWVYKATVRKDAYIIFCYVVPEQVDISQFTVSKEDKGWDMVWSLRKDDVLLGSITDKGQSEDTATRELIVWAAELYYDEHLRDGIMQYADYLNLTIEAHFAGVKK
jgi:hypothetical protein